MTEGGLAQLPLVGRAAELAELNAAFDAVASGTGRIMFISGTSGIGKTRLVQWVSDEAQRRDWGLATGRAFAAESGVPYALLGDALQPAVRRLSPDTMAVLTRGVGELSLLFPWFGGISRVTAERDLGDFRARLYWHLAEFIRNWASREPLVIVLEDLQWADASSLELLHFVMRQTSDVPVLLLCTTNPEHRQRSEAARQFEHSTRRLPQVRRMELGPLQEQHVGEIVVRLFDVDAMTARNFVARLHDWTRGNPFFLNETLEALVGSGALRREDGRWTGWDVEQLKLPGTIREAVLLRLERLSAGARLAADTAAVLGHRFTVEILAKVSDASAADTLPWTEELRQHQVLNEGQEADAVVYDFTHPLIRETLYSQLSAGMARALHATVARALEQHYGDAAMEHADELAYHWMHAPDEAAPRAAVYLAAAGRSAMQKYANREAVDYFAAALSRLDAAGAADEAGTLDIVEQLGRARQRSGEYEGAMALWTRARQWAEAQQLPRRAAAVVRRMALACFWSGRLDTALTLYDEGLALAESAGDAALQVRLRIGQAMCLQELGRPESALDAARAALALIGDGDIALQARVHRTFLLLHLWLGEAALARQHGARALELAVLSKERVVAFLAHWAMALLEGFSGNAAGVQQHLAEAEALADQLHSPVLRLWTDELALEYATTHGDWDRALVIGEMAISRARALQQRTLLPRLLVWTGLIHLGRNDLVRGERHMAEAWELAGADADGTDTSRDVQAVIVAHVGRASLHLAAGDYRAAIRWGEAGLAMADRTGYVVWAVHRLLPIIAEAHLWLRDLDGARSVGARLRSQSEQLGHRLGLAWAFACDTLVLWLSGDSAAGAVLLRRSAEQLESVPAVLDATRVRRQLAGRLAELGDREGALLELRAVHERLEKLGAERELIKARAQFRELGARPPARGTTRSGALLTSREIAIAELVAQQFSSKAIARKLGISVRTVDAHLANIYRKLGVTSRAGVAEHLARKSGGET